MIRIGLFLVVFQLAVNFNACRKAPSALRGASNAARVVAAQPASPTASDDEVEAHAAAWRKQQEEARRKFATLSRLPVAASLPAPSPSLPLAAVQPASSVHVNVDLRPPEMRRGGPTGVLDPAALRINIDGVTRGRGRAGDVLSYDVSPGSHTIAVTNDQDVPIAERVVDAVLGKDVTVVFSE